MRLRCTRCSGALESTPTHALCACCGAAYESCDGVLDLGSSDFYWNQIPRSAMEALLEEARVSSWQKALEKHLLPLAGGYVHRYALDERRADFSCLLPAHRGAVVLDLGCGWGAVTAGLSRRFENVVSADSTLETLRFVRIRLEQEGLRGVRLVRIDPLGTGQLPFPDGGFDAVVLNGVLEWVGHSRSEWPVHRLQEATLKEARRCLCPRGVLYLGIENRFGIELLRGAPDHNGLRFTSLLPRPLASAVSRLRRAGAYRTYTYSLGGYRRLLRRAGFTREALFLPKPSYRQPEYILPGDRLALSYYFRHVSALSGMKRAVARLLARAGLYPYVADSFAWIAEAPA